MFLLYKHCLLVISILALKSGLDDADYLLSLLEEITRPLTRNDASG